GHHVRRGARLPGWARGRGGPADSLRRGAMSEAEHQGKGTPEGDRPHRYAASPWEWVAAGIGTLLVLAAIGTLGYEGIVRPAGPPEIHLTVDSVTRAGEAYVVEFRARNTGPSTAASLVVQ